ncbi:5-oxoprolinase subunit B family protein [Dietzia alimentaria]|uniref:5-oxoprolinase subunit B family protein n=1 Tax=Dietzia alimentaria TaxID=665550 RepID=UPI0003012A58|nr:carboxyltransferase domain-containing protein [Dietzia alimentaria]
MTTTRIRPCGEAALLLECADLAEAVALAGILERLRPDAVDVVAAARTVLVTAPDSATLPRLRRRMNALLAGALPDSGGQPQSPPAASESTGSGGALATGSGGALAAGSGGAREVTIDVRYDGPDLADVAQLAGMSTTAFVRLHTSITWRAAFGGFAPGFFYLVDARDLDARERGDDGSGSIQRGAASNERGAASNRLPSIPRLGSPRTRIPAGSVAVADRFCAVYPGASPGGWRLLGTTDAQLWDLDRPEPALLAPGTSVRFRNVDAEPGGAAGLRVAEPDGAG